MALRGRKVKMSNFKTALDIANKGGIPKPDLQEMYESTIVDDFFLDKLAEYIDEFIDSDERERGDEFYRIYEKIAHCEFEEELEPLEFLLVLRVLVMQIYLQQFLAFSLR